MKYTYISEANQSECLWWWWWVFFFFFLRRWLPRVRVYWWRAHKMKRQRLEAHAACVCACRVPTNNRYVCSLSARLYLWKSQVVCWFFSSRFDFHMVLLRFLWKRHLFHVRRIYLHEYIHSHTEHQSKHIIMNAVAQHTSQNPNEIGVAWIFFVGVDLNEIGISTK